MPKQFLKQRLADFLAWHVTAPLRADLQEIVYQGLFSQQCINFGLRNDFYPVGAAAGYSLMYLLARILTELPVDSVVELGSGQSTLLVDRLKRPQTRHVCYENDPTWHAMLAPRLVGCDYRLRELVDRNVSGIMTRTYRELDAGDFDLLLVDGPNGTDRLSRFGCMDLIAANRRREFILVFDDSGRPGEQSTIAEVARWLSRSGIDYKSNTLSGRTQQTVITTPQFRAASYFY